MKKGKKFDGEKIRKRRIKLGLTQLEMAEKLGYKTAAPYSKIESGRQLPKADSMAVMASVLKCSIEDFYC